MRLALIVFALLNTLVLAAMAPAVDAPAPLAAIRDDSAWQVIPQHPLDPTQPPAADDPRWMPLDIYRSRAYQLANPREPGLGMWIQSTLDIATPPLANDTVVLALANALIADAAFLNGVEMRNETFEGARLQPHPDQALMTRNREPKAEIWFDWRNPTDRSYWTRITSLDRDFTKIRPPMSALFSASAAVLKPGLNRLQLAVFEQSVNTMLPGPLELRAARIDDRVQLNSFTRATGDLSQETVLLVQQALGGAAPIALTMDVEDDLGRVLRTEALAVDFSTGPLRQAIILKPSSPQDYKAVVRATAPGQPAVDHWAYFFQARQQPTSLRTSTALTSTAWEYRAIAQDEAVVFPPPTDGWRQGKPGTGRETGFKHRYYFRLRFEAPADLSMGRSLLEVGELAFKGDFYLNGQSLGTRRHYECPFQLELKGSLKPGFNELLVLIHDGTTPEFVSEGFPPTPDGTQNPPKFASRFRFADLGDVRLNHLAIVQVPTVRVLRNRIVTSVKERTLTVTSTVENSSGATATATPSYTVSDRFGTASTFVGQPVAVPPGGTIDTTTTQPWADAKHWSPDTPHLYALTTTLNAGVAVLDVARERFGFREIAIDGKNFRLNGDIIRFRTVSPAIMRLKRDRQEMPDAYFQNLNIASLRDSKIVGFNALRFRSANNHRAYYAACDEIGLATGIYSELVDNHNDRIAFTDPVTWENSYQEMTIFSRAFGNHASALWYDLGNEIIGNSGPSADPKVADFLYRNQQRIRAYDPTRLIFSSGAEGGYDGRAEIYSPHYPWTGSQSGSFMPTQWWCLTSRYADIPAALRQRTLWPDPDPTNRYRGMTKFPGGAWANVPIFNDEYAWFQDWSYNGNIRGEAQTSAGERTFKPFSPRKPREANRQLGNRGTNANGIGSILTFLERIEMETQAYRAQGLAGLHRWDLEYRLPEGPHMPVVAFLREHVRSYFDDQAIVRTLYVVNDSGSTLTLPVSVRVHRLNRDGSRTPVQTETISSTLTPGLILDHNFRITATKLTEPTTYHAEVIRTDGASERVLHRQAWTVFPRAWTGDIPAAARIAIYDPKASIRGLCENLGVTPEYLVNPSDVARSQARLLIIGEDADPSALTASTPQLAAFMATGGTILALRQPANGGIDGWLPIKLTSNTHWALGRHFAGGATSLTGRNHPLFTGLLPDDFINWGPEGLVFGTSYTVDGARPNTRTLLGLLPFSAHLVEGTHGQGRWIATTLELTPETVRIAPPAAKLLANLVRWSAAAAPVVQPKPSDTVVYAPVDSPLAKILNNTLKVQATYTSTEPGLTGVRTLLLTEWHSTAPTADFAEKVSAWLQAGGTLVVQRGGPALAPWLQTVTGRTVTAEPAFNNDTGAKIVVHPLLDGIFDGDLGWDNTGYDPKAPGTFVNQFLHVDGALNLLAPHALATAAIGTGRVVVDQVLWDTAKIAPRGSRYQRALLTNLGVPVAAPAFGMVRSGFTVPPKLAFSPVPLGEVVTVRHSDLELKLSHLSRTFSIAGVSFLALPSEGKDVVALRSAANLPAALRPLQDGFPTESKPISVRRTADHLFFAHTAYYHGVPEGETVLTYVVRYVGHEKIIGGQDYGDTIALIPVKSGEHIADWHVSASFRPATNAAVFPTASGGGALIQIQRWDNPFPDRIIDSILIRAEPQTKSQAIVVGITAASTAKE